MSTAPTFPQDWYYIGDSSDSGSSPSSSVCGAPSPAHHSLSSSNRFTTFTFTCFNPTLLNCQVIGPNSRPFANINTSYVLGGHTLFTDCTGRDIAVINWDGSPIVEVRDLVPHQSTQHFLKLSPDGRSRSMSFGGVEYLWAPYEQSVCLYVAGPGSPKILARISKMYGAVSLDMTPRAMQLGLLHVAAVATVLLQSGRSID